MLNPALTEMAARDRIAQLQRDAAKRSFRHRPFAPVGITTPQPNDRSIRKARLANPQRAVGWFLVSVGLRLALAPGSHGQTR
jgi:hypothetical protein